MRILLDTNVFARMAQPAHPQHNEAVGAVRLLLGRSDDLVFVPQTMYELWVVATRPAVANGLGFTAAQADAEMARLTGPFTLLPELANTYDEWRRLVVAHGVLGKSAHDAHLVAAMLVHGVTHLLTFNDQDFRRFAGINVLTPPSLLAPPVPSGP